MTIIHSLTNNVMQCRHCVVAMPLGVASSRCIARRNDDATTSLRRNADIALRCDTVITTQCFHQRYHCDAMLSTSMQRRQCRRNAVIATSLRHNAVRWLSTTQHVTRLHRRWRLSAWNTYAGQTPRNWQVRQLQPTSTQSTPADSSVTADSRQCRCQSPTSRNELTARCILSLRLANRTRSSAPCCCTWDFGRWYPGVGAVRRRCVHLSCVSRNQLSIKCRLECQLYSTALQKCVSITAVVKYSNLKMVFKSF